MALECTFSSQLCRSQWLLQFNQTLHSCCWWSVRAISHCLPVSDRPFGRPLPPSPWWYGTLLPRNLVVICVMKIRSALSYTTSLSPLELGLGYCYCSSAPLPRFYLLCVSRHRWRRNRGSLLAHWDDDDDLSLGGWEIHSHCVNEQLRQCGGMTLTGYIYFIPMQTKNHTPVFSNWEDIRWQSRANRAKCLAVVKWFVPLVSDKKYN